MGVMGDPGGSGGTARHPGRRGTLLVEWIEGEIERAGLAAADAALQSVLHGPVLSGFLVDVAGYRRLAFPAAVKQVRRVSIDDEAVKERIGQVPIALLGDQALGGPNRNRNRSGNHRGSCGSHRRAHSSRSSTTPT